MRPGRLIALLGLLLGAAGPAAAQVTVLPVNLEELADRSGTILSGRILSVQSGVGPQRLPVLNVVVEVAQVLKATDRGADARRIRLSRRYRFSQVDLPALKNSDSRLPEYRAGEEVVLFLAPTGPLGLTAPMGIHHGVFRVGVAGQGGKRERLVMNAYQNANLALGGEAALAAGRQGRAARTRDAFRRLERRGIRLSAWERAVLEGETYGPLEYRRFMALVEKLIRPRERARP